jgi:hypothetical protein
VKQETYAVAEGIANNEKGLEEACRPGRPGQARGFGRSSVLGYMCSMQERREKKKSKRTAEYSAACRSTLVLGGECNRTSVGTLLAQLALC